MTVVRVQITQEIRNAPSIGNWQVYRGAVFNVAGSAVPTANQQRWLVRLLNGQDRAATAGRIITTLGPFRTGTNTLRVKTWTRTGGAWVSAYDWTGNLSTEANAAGGTVKRLPMQCAIAVGYRIPQVSGVNPQKGRSRFFLGPLAIVDSWYSDANFDQGGPRLTYDGLNQLAANAHDCCLALSAEGWDLAVRSVGAESATNANEIYVDDVFDVMRSRRPWQLAQERYDL